LEIFNYVARPIVEQVMDGFNGTLFAYGQVFFIIHLDIIWQNSYYGRSWL